MQVFYMSLADAATALGVSRERLRLWIRQGKLPIAGVAERGGYVLSAKTVETVGRKLVQDASQGRSLR